MNNLNRLQQTRSRYLLPYDIFARKVLHYKPMFQMSGTSTFEIRISNLLYLRRLSLILNVLLLEVCVRLYDDVGCDTGTPVLGTGNRYSFRSWIFHVWITHLQQRIDCTKSHPDTMLVTRTTAALLRKKWQISNCSYSSLIKFLSMARWFSKFLFRKSFLKIELCPFSAVAAKDIVAESQMVSGYNLILLLKFNDATNCGK